MNYIYKAMSAKDKNYYIGEYWKCIETETGQTMHFLDISINKNWELFSSKKIVRIKKETLCRHTGMLCLYVDDKEGECYLAELWEHDVLEVSYKGNNVHAEVRFMGSEIVLYSKNFKGKHIPIKEFVNKDENGPYVNGIFVKSATEKFY